MEISNERELHRFTIARGDFRDAEVFLARCQDHHIDSPEYKALAIAAVILYARPFSRNELSPTAPAIASISIDCFSDITTEQRKLHGWLLEQRNKVVAHAEFAYYPTSLTPDTGVIASSRASFPGLTFNPAGVRALAEQLQKQCECKRADFAIATRNAFRDHG